MVVEENKPADDGSVENQSKKAAKKLAKDAVKAAKVFSKLNSKTVYFMNNCDVES